MKLKTKKAINIILIVLLIILIILLILMLFSKSSFSKLKTDVNSSANVEVAKPILVVDGTEDIKIDGIKDTIYNFEIKNYEGIEISDVSMDYSIQIINNSEANLDFELTKNGEKITLTNGKTETMTIKGITRETDSYELKIIYKNNPAIIEDISGNIQVKVESTQSEVM